MRFIIKFVIKNDFFLSFFSDKWQNQRITRRVLDFLQLVNRSNGPTGIHLVTHKNSTNILPAFFYEFHP